ncbi:SprT family zinc-dependent metalloprotease [Mycoplasmopsis glycophila]|uniref:SprT-like domain-containing protein n=1 Tax=Mycoplasmopsis glycophila TaxID=171285 RepID=A0A449AUE0_9BACT|nr:DUF45 domain-containing protein [Mycoplasmopsis glycophila]VEU70090.1 Uncharacterised protein [Mycoplasmopsis glycophila]
MVETYFYNDTIFELEFKTLWSKRKNDFKFYINDKHVSNDNDPKHHILIYTTQDLLELFILNGWKNINFFVLELNKFLDYYIKYLRDIYFVQNEWILNPGKIVYLGRVYKLIWTQTEILENAKYDWKISDDTIEFFLLPQDFKRVMTRKSYLIDFMTKRLREIVLIWQNAYGDLFNLPPIEFEIKEKIPKKDTIAVSQIRKTQDLEIRKIVYTTSLVASSSDLIKKTILHEIIHQHLNNEGGHSPKFYKIGEQHFKDFKLLHSFNVAPNSKFKKI